MKTGLALGSGAARGLTHIGVLNALEEKKISIDYISGSSIGALIGTACAIGMPLSEIGYQTANSVLENYYSEQNIL